MVTDYEKLKQSRSPAKVPRAGIEPAILWLGIVQTILSSLLETRIGDPANSGATRANQNHLGSTSIIHSVSALSSVYFKYSRSVKNAPTSPSLSQIFPAREFCGRKMRPQTAHRRASTLNPKHLPAPCRPLRYC